MQRSRCAVPRERRSVSQAAPVPSIGHGRRPGPRFNHSRNRIAAGTFGPTAGQSQRIATSKGQKSPPPPAKQPRAHGRKRACNLSRENRYRYAGYRCAAADTRGSRALFGRHHCFPTLFRWFRIRITAVLIASARKMMIPIPSIRNSTRLVPGGVGPILPVPVRSGRASSPVSGIWAPPDSVPTCSRLGLQVSLALNVSGPGVRRSGGHRVRGAQYAAGAPYPE